MLTATKIGLLIFCIAWPRAHELSAPDINESKTLSVAHLNSHGFPLCIAVLLVFLLSGQWPLDPPLDAPPGVEESFAAHLVCLCTLIRRCICLRSLQIIFQTQLSLIILAQIFNELCRDLGISNALNAAFVGIIFIAVSQVPPGRGLSALITLDVHRDSHHHAANRRHRLHHHRIVYSLTFYNPRLTVPAPAPQLY